MPAGGSGVAASVPPVCHFEPKGKLKLCLLSEFYHSLGTLGEFYGSHYLELYHIHCQIDFCIFIGCG